MEAPNTDDTKLPLQVTKAVLEQSSKIFSPIPIEIIATKIITCDAPQAGRPPEKSCVKSGRVKPDVRCLVNSYSYQNAP